MKTEPAVVFRKCPEENPNGSVILPHVSSASILLLPCHKILYLKTAAGSRHAFQSVSCILHAAQTEICWMLALKLQTESNA